MLKMILDSYITHSPLFPPTSSFPSLSRLFLFLFLLALSPLPFASPHAPHTSSLFVFSNTRAKGRPLRRYAQPICDFHGSTPACTAVIKAKARKPCRYSSTSQSQTCGCSATGISSHLRSSVLPLPVVRCWRVDRVVVVYHDQDSHHAWTMFGLHPR